jgi:hypothetical protein
MTTRTILAWGVTLTVLAAVGAIIDGSVPALALAGVACLGFSVGMAWSCGLRKRPRR